VKKMLNYFKIGHSQTITKIKNRKLKNSLGLGRIDPAFSRDLEKMGIFCDRTRYFFVDLLFHTAHEKWGVKKHSVRNYYFVQKKTNQ
jgi:hypothetical protein